MREQDLAPEKKYIKVDYNAVTQGYLREYCSSNNFDISTSFSGEKIDPEDFIFHTTVWWTTTSHTFPNENRPININDVVPTNFALFGDNNDILVMEIESDKLEQIRREFAENYQTEDEWPEYRPHITVCYSWDKPLPQVALPDGNEIVADKLTVKKQK